MVLKKDFSALSDSTYFPKKLKCSVLVKPHFYAIITTNLHFACAVMNKDKIDFISISLSSHAALRPWNSQVCVNRAWCVWGCFSQTIQVPIVPMQAHSAALLPMSAFLPFFFFSVFSTLPQQLCVLIRLYYYLYNQK